MSAEIPKPFGYWHEGETYEESEFFLASEFGNVGCDRCTALYTAEDLEQVRQEAARQAMERAAIACEETGKSYDNEWNRNLGVAGDLKDVAEECAEQIRALLPHDTEKRHGDV